MQGTSAESQRWEQLEEGAQGTLERGVQRAWKWGTLLVQPASCVAKARGGGCSPRPICGPGPRLAVQLTLSPTRLPSEKVRLSLGEPPVQK